LALPLAQHLPLFLVELLVLVQRERKVRAA